MRRKPYLSLLLALAIMAGMLALFPTLWMLLVIALLALVTLQVIVVRRHLYRLPAGQSRVAVTPHLDVPAAPNAPAPEGPTPEGAPPASAATPAAASAPSSTSAEPAPAPTEAADAPAPDATPAAGRANIDTALFSRFRQHLEQAEAGGDAPAPAREAAPPPEEEVQDRVELSGAARRSGRAAPARPAPKAPATPPPAAEADSADLFEDLRPPPPPRPPAPQPPPAAARPPAEPPQGGPAAGQDEAATKAPEAPAAPATRPAPPRASRAPEPSGDEVSAALAGPSEGGGLADEAAALLRLAEEAAARESWEGLRAGLDNYLAHLAEAPQLIDWRARRLQVRLAVHDGDVNRALQGFEELLATGHRPAPDDVPALLDALVGGAEPATAASLRVSMLVRILAVFRQARDQRAMDRCYGWIEEAQEQVGDERRLLQYLKNHLEIRKVLGDVPGQLELIDQLGNRCYRLGLTEDAKVYYEMGLRLRAEAEPGSTAPAGPGSVAEG